MNLAERSPHEMNPFANSAQNKKQTKEIVASAFTADEILSIHPIAPNKWGRYVYLRPFLQNKRRKGSLSSRTFLLSLDLRDYPTIIRIFPLRCHALIKSWRARSFQDLDKSQSFCLRVSSRILGICPFGSRFIRVSPVTKKIFS